MALGSQAGFLNLGEVGKLPDLIVQGGLCSCGLEYPECPFWKRYALELPPADLGLAEWSEDSAGPEYWSNLFDRISADTARRYLIDTSKDPRRALLIRAQHPSSMIIHLVRSPWATWVSDKKYRHKDWECGQTLQAWCRTHKFILDNLATPNFNYCRIRYEDFALAPIETLNDCMHRLGIQQSAVLSALSPGHQAGGNPTRSTSMNVRRQTPTPMPEKFRLGPEQVALLTTLGYGAPI